MSEYVGLKQGKVHESHVISEYYCGGCGWPVTDHDSYCPECGGELHEGMGKSRWHELFGTPERAALTLAHNTPSACDECVLIDMCDIGMPTCILRDCDALLKWLRGDAS